MAVEHRLTDRSLSANGVVFACVCGNLWPCPNYVPDAAATKLRLQAAEAERDAALLRDGQLRKWITQNEDGVYLYHKPACAIKQRSGACDCGLQELLVATSTADTALYDELLRLRAMEERAKAERDYMVEQGEKGHGTCRIIGEHLTALLDGAKESRCEE